MVLKRSEMILNKNDVEFVLKFMSDFKKTQPRKKRQNIDRAMRKNANSEPLNRLEKEAIGEFQDFFLTYDFERTDNK